MSIPVLLVLFCHFSFVSFVEFHAFAILYIFMVMQIKLLVVAVAFADKMAKVWESAFTELACAASIDKFRNILVSFL